MTPLGLCRCFGRLETAASNIIAIVANMIESSLQICPNKRSSHTILSLCYGRITLLCLAKVYVSFESSADFALTAHLPKPPE